MIPFVELGQGDEVVHFAHANGYPPKTYRQFLNLLAQRFRVVAMQPRALWDTSDPWQTLTSWQLIADDLVALLDQQAVSNVVGVGHSLGAVATFYAALARPDLFKRIVMIEPVFLLPQMLAASAQVEDAKQMPHVATALRRRNRWANRQAVFDHYRPKRVFARMSDASLWDYAEHATVVDSDGVRLAYPPEWEARFYAMPPQDVWELLPQLELPTLAIGTSESDTLFPQAWKLWQQKQPGATFIKLDQVGHLVTHEAPQRLADVVLDWLATPLEEGAKITELGEQPSELHHL